MLLLTLRETEQLNHFFSDDYWVEAKSGDALQRS